MKHAEFQASSTGCWPLLACTLEISCLFFSCFSSNLWIGSLSRQDHSSVPRSRAEAEKPLIVDQ